MRRGDWVRAIAFAIFFGLIGASIGNPIMDAHYLDPAMQRASDEKLIFGTACGVVFGVFVSWLYRKSYRQRKEKPKITE
jgi:uncharacterized protein YacL